MNRRSIDGLDLRARIGGPDVNGYRNTKHES
jgi:hypothetical protein